MADADAPPQACRPQDSRDLGNVQAVDVRTAEAAAVAEINLNEEQPKRLAVREGP